jgi:hexosaminidase
VLAEVVEPVKDYRRGELASTPPTSATPLNRLIDAVPPESDRAREFAALVERTVSGSGTPQSRAQIRAFLTTWRDNHAHLQPLLSDSFLLKEVAPISEQLSALSAAGLQALELLEKNERPSDAWKVQSLTLTRDAAKPKAQLLLVVAPAVEKLIQASSRDAMAGTSP